MRPLPLLLPLSLLLLLPPALASDCPAHCDCALDSSPLELVCQRDGGARVALEGERTKHLYVICKQNATNFTCEDVPEFDFGRNGSLGEISVVGCPMEGLAIACVLARVRAREVRSVCVEEPPGGPRLRPDHVRGLRGVRQVFLKGREKRDEEVDIPWAAVELLPGLEQLTVQSARARLGSGAPGSGSGASGSGSVAARLLRLEVSMAGLPSPPPGAFAGLASLTELSLFQNYIDNITQDTFQNLTSLLVLDLSSNTLPSLEGAALAGCPHLRELHVYDNPLEQLGPLAPLQHLEKLDIHKCNSPHLEVAAGALAHLPRLKHVDLNSCEVLMLPDDAFTGSTALETLDLSENQLSALPATLFADQTALRALDLSGNQLAALPRELFWGLKALQRLHLDDNRLLELPDHFVEGLPLTQLSVSGNQLRRLSRAAFLGADALQHLDLSHNQLGQDADGQYRDLDTSPSPFNSLLKLRTLDLSHNQLTAVPLDLATALLHLTSLDASHNNISYVTDLDNSLNFLSANATVDLRHNQISAVELSPAWSRVAPVNYTSRVLLEGNPLRCDCRLYQLVRRVRGWHGVATQPAFAAAHVACAAPAPLAGTPLANVTDDDLSCDIPAADCARGCDCYKLPINIAMNCTDKFDALPPHFASFPLNLTLRFPPTTLSWLPPNVETLDLSDLNMTEVPMDFNYTAMKSFDLRGNELASVPAGILGGNATVWVARNPLACDCWRADSVRALQSAAAAGRIPDWSAASCAAGGAPRLVDADRLCRTLVLSVGSTLLGLLGILSVVAAMLLLRYSMHVKVFLYTRGWCRCWVRETRDQGRFEYDAFLSFAHEDAHLVMDTLLPGLERGPRPFRVCVHYRDWIAGEWIPAQIAQSVDRSRYTIVVVSKHFLDSKWGRLEFRAANMSAIQEKRARVIVVLLEEVVSHPQLDAELKAYFATNTYLKWSDPWFWDRLRYALRHKAEPRMRRAGQKLAQLMAGGEDGEKGKGKTGLIGGEILPNGAKIYPNGGKTGGIDTQLAPNGKILNAAIKAKEHKISGIV